MKMIFSVKTDFYGIFIKFTKFPVSGTSKTIEIPQVSLLFSPLGRESWYFHLKFMIFVNFRTFHENTHFSVKIAIFALFTLLGPPARNTQKPCKFPCLLGVKSPQGAIWVEFSNFHQNVRELAKIS